jgi:integrase
MARLGLVPFTRQWTRGGVFGFRFQLPADVFEALVAAGTAGTRRTVTFSLKTRDPLAARSRALRAAADVGDMISAVRAGTIPRWQFDPAAYRQDRIIIPATGRKQSLAKQVGPATSKSKGMTLRRVYKEVYLPRRQERKGAVPRRRSRLDMEKAITRFVASAGDLAVNTITRKDAEKFVRSLKVGSVATMKKTVTCLSTICNAAVAAGVITSNPFRGLGPDRAAIVAARRSYSRFDHDQLARFFGRTEREDGAVLWLPRLLLLTGARLEEMAQLRAAWFMRRDGVEVIDLHEAKVKNPHNKRYIPLHRDLIDLGVLDLVRGSPDRLFTELKYRASAESWSSAISMKLNREIDAALGTDRRLTVHSLRKTFEHAAYVKGVPKATINAITGHKPGDISEEHYLLLQDDLPLLKRHIDQIDFPFLRRIAA